MAAESSAASWAGLRADLLGRVLERLPCPAHRAAFAAVCFNWRSLTLESQSPLQQLPSLLLPSAGEQGPSFFCLTCGDAHRVFLPDDVRGARCCGSFPGGWLVLALEQFRDYALHNLRTGQRIDLPEGLDAPGAADNPFLIMHAAASTRGDPCLAAAVTLSASNIAFWRPGMDRWSPPTPAAHQGPGSWSAMVPKGTISDMLYYSGHGLEGFHVLTDTEDLLVYVREHGPAGAGLRTRLVTYRFPNHRVASLPPVGERAITRYLVEYLGELLMVLRAVSLLSQGNTVAFSVFRLTGVVQNNIHNRDASWCEIQVHDGLVFLGRCSSRAYDLNGVGLDGFYFLDDATSNHDVNRVMGPNRQYPCSDMGWLPLRSPQVYKISPGRPQSEYSGAAWFFH